MQTETTPLRTMRETDLPGVLLLTASAAAFSTAGLFTRLIQADTWTVLAWRGLFGGLFIGAWVLRHDGAAAFRRIGVPGLLAASCSTVATICFIQALRRTSVADVTLIYATAPFVAAAATWLWAGETPRRTTLLASLAMLLGVAIMLGAAPAAGQLVGKLLALAMTVLMAVMIVIIRGARQTPMLPAACLSCLACTALALPFAHPAAVGLWDLLWLALFGTTQFGLGLLLLTLGSRLLPPARTALIGNLELPLGPLWVWLAFGEGASRATWLGGGLVVVAVLFDMLMPVETTPARAGLTCRVHRAVLLRAPLAALSKGSSPGAERPDGDDG